jgi:hypothetical protein
MVDWSGLSIAVLNILDDTELVQACAEALAEKIDQMDYDMIVTAGKMSFLWAICHYSMEKPKEDKRSRSVDRAAA